MKKIQLTILTTLFVGAIVFFNVNNALATPVSLVENYDGTGFSAVTLTGVYTVGTDLSAIEDGTASNLLMNETGYEASGIIGIFSKPSVNDKPLADSNNIGEYGDGYLNGEQSDKYSPYSGTNYDDVQPFDDFVFTGLEFVDEFQDILGDGSTYGPGWIYLGKNEEENVYVGSSDLGVTIKVSDVLTLDVNVSEGLWTIIQQENTFEDVSKLLGSNYFDQLAIVLKTSTSWAIYQLDFNQIFGIEFSIFGNTNLGFEPVILTGTFDTGDLGGKDISHISFWAHDPAGGDTNVVPEPSTFILLGSGLIGLGLYRRRKAK